MMCVCVCVYVHVHIFYMNKVQANESLTIARSEISRTFKSREKNWNIKWLFGFCHLILWFDPSFTWLPELTLLTHIWSYSCPPCSGFGRKPSCIMGSDTQGFGPDSATCSLGDLNPSTSTFLTSPVGIMAPSSQIPGVTHIRCHVRQACTDACPGLSILVTARCSGSQSLTQSSRGCSHCRGGHDMAPA